MNEEITQAFNQFIANSLNLLDNGVDFAKEQIPLVLQEIIRWKTVESGAYTALGLIFGIIITILCYKAGKKALIDDDDNYYPACFVIFLAGISSWFMFIYNLMNFLKVITAPRLVLIEYLKGLM